MKQTNQFVVVLVTTPDQKTARKLAKAALEEHLVACANCIPKVESHFWWEGKVESDSEVLILFKSARNRLAALEKLIMKEHPYDVPEFIVLPLTGGSAAYLEWLGSSVRR